MLRGDFQKYYQEAACVGLTLLSGALGITQHSLAEDIYCLVEKNCIVTLSERLWRSNIHRRVES